MTAPEPSVAAIELGVDQEVVITRTFTAPPELVFQAWTDPARLARWWGTAEMTGVASEIDLRPGGAWRACMRSPKGVDHWAGGTFQEIDPPHCLVMTFAWEATGDPETLLTISLDPAGAATTMTFRHGSLGSQTSRDGHAEGWNESFDNLAAYLGDLREEKAG